VVTKPGGDRGDGRARDKNQGETDAGGDLTSGGCGCQAGSGGIGARGRPGGTDQLLGPGYPSIGSAMGRASKRGFVASSGERFIGPLAGRVRRRAKAGRCGGEAEVLKDLPDMLRRPVCGLC